MERTHRVLQGFFWFAFAAFLLASIPHVAYFFRAYEPIDAARDTLYWLISYGIAVSIDVTIFLLSVTVAGLQRQHQSLRLICSVWVFIIGLAALSWYINFKYAAHFIDISMISPTAVTLPWLGRLPDINPIIASMFQAMAIAYTWIADKIGAGEQVKTAAQLKAEADELEKAMQEKQRIATLQRGGKVSALTGLLDAGKTLVTHVQNMSPRPPDTQVNTAEVDEQNTGIGETFTQVKTMGPDEQSEDGIPAISESIRGGNDGQTSPHIALTPDVLAVLEAFPNITMFLTTSRKTVTIEEIETALHQSHKMVLNRVKDGTLKRSPRNDKLIIISSVVEWAKTLVASAQNERKTETLRTIKLVHNEQITESMSAIEDEQNAVLSA